MKLILFGTRKSEYYLSNISRMLFERHHFRWSPNTNISTTQLTDKNMTLNNLQNILMAGDINDVINNKLEYLNLAFYQKSIGAIDVARRILENYIKIIGLDISAGMNLADIYNHSSEFLKAEELFSQINIQWPNYASAYCCMSMSLARRNEITEALNVLNKAVEYINYFEGDELKIFCITYATVALKNPITLRDFSIFNRLKTYHDDYHALAHHSLKYTYYPKVKDSSYLKEIIDSKLIAGKKFLITRPGNTEVIAASNNQFTPSLQNNAGISEPNIATRKVSFNIWLQQYNSAMKMSDGVMLVRSPSDLCSSYVSSLGIPEEKYLNCPAELEVWLGLLEKLLKNFKILFISSFSESININKYEINKIHNYKYNFNIDNILEIQAPFTLAGEPQKSWMTERDNLLFKINKIEFDIAFVSCGGYGHSVCLEVFNKNKSAIYVGGFLQTFFGIIGNRWSSDREFVRKFMNPSWTKPLASEIPLNSHLVENSCYW
jgi:tetratricopeptide (TPR) repeat protein